MYKIVLNNVILPVILLIVNIALCVSVGFLNLPISSASVPLWMIVGGAFGVFIISSVLLYTHAEIKHYLIISVIMLVIYTLSMIAIFGCASLLGLQKVLSLSGLNLSINPILIVLPIVLSIVSTKFLIDLKQIKPKEELKKDIKEEVKTKEKEPVPELVEKTPELKIEEKIKPQTVVAEDVFEEIQPEVKDITPPIVESKPEPVAQETKKEIFFEDIMDEVPPPSTVAPTPELPIEPELLEESKPEIFFEDIVDVNFEQPKPVELKQEVSVPVVETVTLESTFEDVNPLEELVPLEGDITELAESKDAEVKPAFESVIDNEKELEKVTVSAETTTPDVKSFEPISIKRVEDADAPIERPYIPKLAEESRPKNFETTGKITSIGKLLVDHRDIENIIETNALMQSVGSEVGSTKIISAISGGKTNEKLATISEIGGTNACIVVDDAGFIHASTLKDLHREQVIGAMAYGTFAAISSNLNKMGFQPAKDVIFESETGAVILNKYSSSNVIAILVNPGVQLYQLQEVNELVATAGEREPADLIQTSASINGVIGAVLAKNTGELIESKLIDDSKVASNIAYVLPAFYSNAGVFIKNMDQGSLRKIIANTGNEVIYFTSIGSNILMLYATLNTAIIPKDTKIQYETIISS